MVEKLPSGLSSKEAVISEIAGISAGKFSLKNVRIDCGDSNTPLCIRSFGNTRSAPSDPSLEGCIIIKALFCVQAWTQVFSRCSFSTISTESVNCLYDQAAYSC